MREGGLVAVKVRVDRVPAGEATGDGGGGSPSLPLRIALARLRIDHLEVDTAVAGTVMDLAVDASAELRGTRDGTANLTLTHGADRYAVALTLMSGRLSGEVTLREAAGGLVSTVAGLPDLGAITARATVDGPLDGVGLDLTVQAGLLRAAVRGMVSVTVGDADLRITATAPGMRPNADLRWQAVAVDAALRGPLTAPFAAGTVDIEGLHAGGASVDAIRARITGDTGQVQLRASLDGTRLPGVAPDMLAGLPVNIDAAIRMKDATRPVRLALHHPRLTAEATGTLMPRAAALRLTVPDLAPFAALAGVALQGDTVLDLSLRDDAGATSVSLRGPIRISAEQAPAPAIIGDRGAIDIAATRQGDTVTLTRAEVTGHGLDLSMSRQATPTALTLDWIVRLTDLARLQPTLTGAIEAKGRLSGPANALVLHADVTGSVAGAGC
jgi:translocation and assembly module TamB